MFCREYARTHTTIVHLVSDRELTLVVTAHRDTSDSGHQITWVAEVGPLPTLDPAARSLLRAGGLEAALARNTVTRPLLPGPAFTVRDHGTTTLAEHQPETTTIPDLFTARSEQQQHLHITPVGADVDAERWTVPTRWSGPGWEQIRERVRRLWDTYVTEAADAVLNSHRVQHQLDGIDAHREHLTGLAEHRNRVDAVRAGAHDKLNDPTIISVDPGTVEAMMATIAACDAELAGLDSDEQQSRRQLAELADQLT